MAISTRGMRRVVVGDDRFLWRFREDEDRWNAGTVTIVSETANTRGRRTPQIVFRVPLDKGFFVTPKIIRRAIEYSRAHTTGEADLLISAEQASAFFE